MAVTRRNALIGLGALVGGAGVFAATGAFTTVEAQREVEVQTTGDADANLGLRPVDGSDIVDDSGEVIEINTDGINLRARTTFGPELVITNNGTETVEIDILDDFGGSSLVEEGGPVDFLVNDGSENITVSTGNGTEEISDSDLSDDTTIASGESVAFELQIDLTDGAIPDPPDNAPVDTVDKADAVFDEIFAEDDDGDSYLVIEANAT